MSDRYEIRDYTEGSSRKQFHIWDKHNGCDVFHTNNYGRAEQVLNQAGTGDITQHLKDYGHPFVPTEKWGKCPRCKR
jgi:hypothetical protein